MNGHGLRFIHASELHLGAPLFGVGGLPYPLRTMMVNARYRAAERVFARAIESRVDFVLLVGNVLSESASGPRPCWFLAEQCAQLAHHNIPVYWVEHPVGRNLWSDYVPLPANLVIGNAQEGQVFEHATRGRGRARIACGSAAAGLQESDILQIAVLPDGLDGLPLAPVGVDYWALGGRTTPGVAPSLCGLAQFAGTTQGHAPSDVGPRGCELVTIDRRRRCSSEFVETDSVRWHEERVRVAGNLDWNELRDELMHRQERLLKMLRCDLLMIRWTLSGRGGLWQQLRREDVCRQLKSMLVRQARDRQPAAWSFVIDLAPDAEQLEAWTTEETPFGEAVRLHGVAQRGTATVAAPQPHFPRHAAPATPRGRLQAGHY